MNHLNLDGNALMLMKPWLPESALHLKEAIGWEAAAALIERFGGARFPISKGIREKGNERINLLLEVLTPEQLGRLLHVFGGESQFVVPRCDRAKREWRNRLFMKDINAALTAGESHRAALIYLCPRYGIGNTLAWKIINDHRSDGGNLHDALH